jgi:hypothetical protein
MIDQSACLSCGAANLGTKFCENCGQPAAESVFDMTPTPTVDSAPLLTAGQAASTTSAPQPAAFTPNAQPATINSAQGVRGRPRYFLGTFWVVVSLFCFIAGFRGLWWSVLLGLACFAYAIYLYRGGRFGFFFF